MKLKDFIKFMSILYKFSLYDPDVKIQKKKSCKVSAYVKWKSYHELKLIFNLQKRKG